MSNITVKMFPAKNGDCFLVSLGLDNKKHILIDCGYVDTYTDHLKKELIEIANNGESIDLMVITHVDQDHVLGAIAFLEENNRTSFIEIKEIWHNSYRHLQFEKENVEKITEQELKILNAEIALGTSFLKRKMRQSRVTDEKVSANQGSMLASLILEGGYPWNKSFDGKAVNCENMDMIFKNQYTINLISPNTDKLKSLSKVWLRELKKHEMDFSLSNEAKFDDAYEFFLIRRGKSQIVKKNISSSVNNNEISIENSALENSKEEIDNSITNGSSISFIIECQSKKLVFLADAHPDIIYDNISKLGETYFDLVKLPHHGSNKNITMNLIEKLNSSLFLISTNGDRHGHPDFNSIARIIYYQRSRFKKFIFNYNTNTSKVLNNLYWKDRYNYQIYTRDGNDTTIVEL